MNKRVFSIETAVKALITLAFALVLWRSITDNPHGGDVLLQFELRTSQDNIFKLSVNGRAEGKMMRSATDFQRLTYAIPREEIHDLQLALGDKSATVTFHRLTARNFSRQQRRAAGRLRPLISHITGVVRWSLDGEGAKIISAGGDARIVFSEKMIRIIHTLQSNSSLPLLVTVFLSALFFLLLHASDPLQPWRMFRCRPVSPLGIIFFIFLFLPLFDSMLHFSRRWPLPENRALATAPVFRFDAFWGFPELYQRYYADHFGMRSVMIRVYNQLRLRSFRLSPNPGVLLGKKGWLFLAQEGDSRNVIDYYRGLQPFAPAELEHWLRVFRGRRDWLRQRGIRYLVVWVPDKTSIYPEVLPSALRRVRAVTRLDQLLAYAASRSDLPMLDLRLPLRKAKEESPVFLRTDTHWNDFGGYIGYGAIIDRLHADFPRLIPISRSDLIFSRQTIPGGDLASMLTMAESMPETQIAISFRLGAAARKIPLLPPPNSWITWSATEIPGSILPRAVVFHDSFTQRIMKYLSEHFSRIFYLWDRQIRFDTDLIAREEPDVVIEVMAERFLLGFIPENSDRLSSDSCQGKAP